jgi:hypothetical protein
MSIAPASVLGQHLSALIDAARADDAARDPLHQALLVEPLCVAEIGPGAPAGPTVKLGHEPTSPQQALLVVAKRETAQIQVRLAESPVLGAPVVPLFASGAAMAEFAVERALWPDGRERGVVYEAGAVFALLRGHPGALLVADARRSIALDAGDLAALGERKLPAAYDEALRSLATSGRPREAARRLAGRPLYTLGHPQGGMLLLQRELPVFLHLPSAQRFADRLARQVGTRVQHGLVAAAELWKNAVRGKLVIHVEPGPLGFRLRPDDLR